MAVDFLLLQRYPRGADARFRHYGWRSPAFTFGYSQKISFVRGQLPQGEPSTFAGGRPGAASWTIATTGPTRS